MDRYESIRATPFASLASVLGIDLKRYKTRKGGEYYGPCPIHNPKNNSTSFSYAPDGRFNCFSCGAKGKGAIDVVKLAKAVGFQAAVELLVPIQTTSVATNAPQEPESGHCRPLEKNTWRKYQVPCEWLENRVPDAAVRERYGVFCYNNPARKSAYSGRVMIPVRDIEGVLYGYLGRSIHQEVEPKYLFPAKLPKSQFLFGAAELHAAGQLPLRIVYLVESPFCVMKFASLGLPAVSPFGWSVSEEQLRILQHLAKGIVYWCDRNKYQERGPVLSAIANSMWVKSPPLPDGIDDPEHLSIDQILALTR